MERLFTVVNQIYVHTIIDFMWAKIQNTCIQEIQSIQHTCYICPGRGTVTPQYTYLGSLEDVEALETTGIVAVPAVTGGNKHLGITRH